MRVLLVLALLVAVCQAFVPVHKPSSSLLQRQPLVPQQQQHQSLSNQRRSVAQVQLQGLFGLGAPEIAIILVAAAFLLGPQKLAELGKDAGKIAGELKEVPKEFQKGLEEGEKAAKENMLDKGKED